MADAANTEHNHRTASDHVVLVVVGVAGFLLILYGGLYGGLTRWIGVAGWLAIAPDVLRLPRVRAVAPFLARWLPIALVIGSFIALMHPLLRGHMPASRDHGIHFFQTRVLYEELLPTGRLWGWSDQFNHGYPFGESYPTLGYLATGAAHALSFGVVGLRTSYAWAVAGFWGLGAIAVWWVAAEIVSELPTGLGKNGGRWAGCVAALLWLFDPGASRQGGWNYLMFHGVWPQMLSSVLWTLSLVLFWRALKHPSPRAIAAAGLVLGASVLAHPFGVIAAAGSACCWLLLLLLRNDPARPTLRIWLLVHLLASALCLGWLSAFFGSADSMDRSPVLWRTLGDVTYDLLTGKLFDTHWAWLGPLFIAGLVATVKQRKPFGLLILGLTLAMIVLASRESLWILELDLLLSAFKNLQFPRYTIEFKPLFFALCGLGAASLGNLIQTRTGRAPHHDHRHTRGRGTWFLVAIVLAPFVTSLAEGTSRLATRPVGALDTLQRSPYADDEADLLAALQSESAELSDRPLRVAVFRQHMGGGTYAILSVTDAGGELVLDGHVPAVNFRHRFSRHPQSLEALDVTHAIYDSALPEKEQKLAGLLEPVGEFGPYTLARLPRTPLHPLAKITEGAGRVAIENRGAEDLALEVTGTTAATSVVVRRAPHVRWEATFDGEPIEIEIDRSVRGFAQLRLRVPGDGTLVLHYRRSGTERAAAWCSLVAFLAGMLCLLLGRAVVWTPHPVTPARQLPVIAAALALLALVAFGVRHRQQNNLAKTWTEAATEIEFPRGDATPTFVADAVDDGRLRVAATPSRICDGLMGKDVLEGCDDADHAPQMSAGYRDPFLFRCIEFTVAPGGEATVTLDNEGHDVAGFLIRRESGTRRVRVGLGLGGKVILFKTALRDFYVRGSEAPDGFVASVANAGQEPERFCVAAALIDPP